MDSYAIWLNPTQQNFTAYNLTSIKGHFCLGVETKYPATQVAFYFGQVTLDLGIF